jgi:hypothetical protein
MRFLSDRRLYDECRLDLGMDVVCAVTSVEVVEDSVMLRVSDEMDAWWSRARELMANGL